MRVKATREGLIGDVTASGWRIDAERSFVALPSHKALHRFVLVTNPLTGLSTRAEVLDVGPWCEHDDAYVFEGARPLSESGWHVDTTGKLVQGITNGAGIDLGEAVWRALAMTDNGDVEWTMEPLVAEPIVALRVA